MTRPARATTAEIKRAVQAVLDAGLAVSGVTIAKDGAVTVHSAPNATWVVPMAPEVETTEDWESR